VHVLVPGETDMAAPAAARGLAVSVAEHTVAGAPQ
jgi:hypothetical protein